MDDTIDRAGHPARPGLPGANGPAEGLVRSRTRTADTSARVYEALRNKAINYELRPGAHVNELALAAEFKVSRTPVREALKRLESEGIVTVVPNKGFFRQPLDIELIRSLFEVRIAVEVLAVRLFCKRASDVDCEALRAQWRAAKAGSADLAPAAVEKDEAFHVAIARGSRNQELVRLLSDLNSRIRFVRTVAMANRALRKVTSVDHDPIIKALCARDSKRSAELKTRHIGLTLDDATGIVRESVVRIYLGEEDG
jgi:DNA-binding GntR family transcriptional regulator